MREIGFLKDKYNLNDDSKGRYELAKAYELILPTLDYLTEICPGYSLVVGTHEVKERKNGRLIFRKDLIGIIEQFIADELVDDGK